MGQARARGTFEERKEIAIVRDRKEAEHRAKMRDRDAAARELRIESRRERRLRIKAQQILLEASAISTESLNLRN